MSLPCPAASGRSNRSGLHARALGCFECAAIHAAAHAEYATGAAREAASSGSLRLYLTAVGAVSISAAAAIRAADIARHALLGGGIP